MWALYWSAATSGAPSPKESISISSLIYDPTLTCSHKLWAVSKRKQIKDTGWRNKLLPGKPGSPLNIEWLNTFPKRDSTKKHDSSLYNPECLTSVYGIILLVFTDFEVIVKATLFVFFKSCHSKTTFLKQ